MGRLSPKPNRGGKRARQKIKDWLEGKTKTQGNPEQIDIKSLGLNTLEDVEKRIRTLDHEEIYFFDGNDNLVDAYKGDARGVLFPTALLDMKDATVTHGHPKGAEEFGGTFSFNDIDNMLDSNWREHRATASGQGEMNYIMRRTANADTNGLRKRINLDAEDLEDRLTSAYKEGYAKARKRKMAKTQAQHVARQKMVGVLNAYYKEIMPKYGFKYITRKKGYKYNR